MSPGVWPRSTAALPSRDGAGLRRAGDASAAHGAERRGDRGAVEALAADDDETRQARFVRRATGGRNSARRAARPPARRGGRLAGNVEKALERAGCRGARSACDRRAAKRGGIGDRPQRDDETVEIVVIVLGRRDRGARAARRDRPRRRRRGRAARSGATAAMRGAHELDARPQPRGERALGRRERGARRRDRPC